MPVDVLFVEGKLDAELLTQVLGGSPTVEMKGGKRSLPMIARDAHGKKDVSGKASVVRYLRDRDFDFEPAGPGMAPSVDSCMGNEPLGWRWRRHSMENYLLEPAITCAALKADESSYRAALVDAGRRIQHYQAARWAIGVARRALPPYYELETKPEGADEFFLPKDLQEDAAKSWAVEQVKTFAARVVPVLEEASISTSFDRYVMRFESEVCRSEEAVLIWFSGKDLIVALRDWWSALGVGDPGNLRARIRDWMWRNPGEALAALPEWQELVGLLR